MNHPDLIPKPKRPRVMLQPRKDSIRLWWELALAEWELALAELELARTPWWWRLWHRAYARIVETDKQTAALAALERV